MSVIIESKAYMLTGLGQSKTELGFPEMERSAMNLKVANGRNIWKLQMLEKTKQNKLCYHSHDRTYTTHDGSFFLFTTLLPWK